MHCRGCPVTCSRDDPQAEFGSICLIDCLIIAKYHEWMMQYGRIMEDNSVLRDGFVKKWGLKPTFLRTGGKL